MYQSSKKRTNKEIGIGIPVFNEEATIKLHLQNVFEVLSELPAYQFHVFIIDDGSIDQTVETAVDAQIEQKYINFSILKLKYNVGHQRAILQGVLFAKKENFDHLIIMDGDGEDDPKALPELLEKINTDIVFVARGRRKESTFFILFSLVLRYKSNKIN